MKFSDLNLDRRLLKALEYNDLTEPTPIQEKAIPHAINREDVIGIAPTGSGKTFAYALPMLNWLLNAKIKHKDPAVLILVPTRELVKQVDNFIQELCRFTEVFTARVYAGQRQGKQIRTIEEDTIDIIIATPGRLINFLEDNVVSLKNLSVFILDEVDMILDMGFQEDIEKILPHIPHKNSRQTMLWGSTLPPNVEALAKGLQKRTRVVDVGRAAPPDEITHQAFEVHEDKKFDVLVELLHDPGIDKVIVFVGSRHEARITARNLRREGLPLEETHGGLTQRQRSHALSNFRSGEVNALVASDMASRGLDITGVTHVIHFNVPSDFNTYVHRAGRTGRAYHDGFSWLLVSPSEFANLANIESKLGEDIPRLRQIRQSRKKGKPKKAARIDKITWRREDET